MQKHRIVRDKRPCISFTQSDNNLLPLGYQKFAPFQTGNFAGYSIPFYLPQKQATVQIDRANRDYLAQNNELGVEVAAK